MNPLSHSLPPSARPPRYKYQKVMAKPMDTEEFMRQQEIWVTERNAAIAKAQAEGRDY